MNDYMTVKEIADLCEKTEKTIRVWISKVFPTKMQHGNETRLSIDEVEQLFNSAFGKKVSALLMQSSGKNVSLNSGKNVSLNSGKNVSLNSGKNVSLNSEKNVIYDLEDGSYHFHMMKAMEALERKIEHNKQMIKAQTKYLYRNVERQKIEAPKYYTIKAWVSMHSEDFGLLEDGDYISLGRKASRLSRNMILSLLMTKNLDPLGLII